MHNPTNEIRDDDKTAIEEVDGQNTVDVNVIEVRLPCRAFRISYKVAEAGEFSLTTEFLLRLLRLVDGLPESAVGDFFGFTNDEARFVVDLVEGQGYAERSNGKIRLTSAGHGLFAGSDEPALFEVHSKEERFEFDLVSFAPADSFKALDEFALKLPELQVSEVPDGGQVSQVVVNAFKRFFSEFRLKRGGTRLEHQNLYTVDEVQAEQRFSTLVPLTLAVRTDEPGFPEVSLVNWRSGTELEDRAAIVDRCADVAKEIRLRSDQVNGKAAEVLGRIAPVQMLGLLKAGAFNADGFFRAAVKHAGELRVDRPTVRAVGQLWTNANRVRFAAALKYALTKSNGPPQMQMWLRPSVPHWGSTRRISEILTSVEKQFTEKPENGLVSLPSVVIGDDRRHVPFKHIFNGVITLPASDLSSGLEMFLVPGHLAYVAVYASLGRPEGYPIPLGVISFDPETVARAQLALLKILDTSLAVPYHCDWGAKDMVSSVRAAL